MKKEKEEQISHHFDALVNFCAALEARWGENIFPRQSEREDTPARLRGSSVYQCFGAEVWNLMGEMK